MKKIKPELILFIIISAAAVVYILNFDFFAIGHFNDDAYYINAARWFAGTQGIQKFLTGSSLGFSFLLIPVAKLFPENNFPFILPSFFFSLGTLVLLYLLLKKKIGAKITLILVLLTAFSPYFVRGSGVVMSEAAFLFLSILVLYLLEKYTGKSRISYAGIFFVALTLSLSSFVRSEGFILFFCIWVYFIISKSYREALYLLFFFIVLILAVSRFNVETSVDRYIFGWSYPVFSMDFLKLLTRSSTYYLKNLTDMVFPTDFARTKAGNVEIVPAIVFFLVYAAGFSYAYFKKINPAVKIYLVLYLLVHIIFQSVGQRFLIGILPFLLLLFLSGVRRFGEKAVFAVSGIILALFVTHDILMIRHMTLPLNPETFSFVRENTSPSAIFISNFSSRFFLYTGRKASPLPSHKYCDGYFNTILRKGAGYISLFDTGNLAGDCDFPNSAFGPNRRTEKFVKDKKRFEVFYVNPRERAVIFKVKEDFKKSFGSAYEIAAKGMEKFKEGKYDEAEKFFREAYKENPCLPALINNFALLFVAQNRFDEAERLLLEGIKNTENSPILYAQLGKLYKVRGDLKKAEENYVKAIKISAELYDRKTEKLARYELKNWPDGRALE